MKWVLPAKMPRNRTKCVTSSWPSGRQKNREAIYDNMRGESPKKAVESPAVRPVTAIRQSRCEKCEKGRLPCMSGEQSRGGEQRSE
jgi:hypothetical protein